LPNVPVNFPDFAKCTGILPPPHRMLKLEDYIPVNKDQAQLSHLPHFAPTSLDLNLYLPSTQLLVAFNLM